MRSRENGDWAPSDALSHLFFQGQYDALLERPAQSTGDTHPAVIGALAMVGRLEEALAIASLPASDQGPCHGAMVQFVLCMGECHAGRYDDALRRVAQLLLDTRRRGTAQESSDLARFFARQGAAMIRYFTGRMRKARQHALVALAYSWRAGLDYARLIALELNGHVSVQVGELQKGLRTLEDAHALAISLGYTANAQTIRLSTLTYALRTVDKRQDASAELTALIESRTVSRFARRNGLLSLALDHAVAGRVSTARELLGQANLLALRNEDLRGNERAMTIAAFLASLAGELEIASELWNSVERSARGEASSFVEVCYLAALAGRSIDRVALQGIADRTGLHRAKIALYLDEGQATQAWLDWPAIGVFPRSRASLIEHLESHDALGLLPRCLGRSPGRRIYLTGERWLVEDRGDICAIDQPVRNGNQLLGELASEPRSKGRIFQAIWKQSYNARLHDATLQKLISRCRKVLGDRSHWIESTGGGYQLAEGLELIDLDGGGVETQGAASGEDPTEDGPTPMMRQLGVFTSGELAQRLRVSKATAVRLIRREMEHGRLVKCGSGKNTSYQVSDDPQARG